jgi:hypothetical protein
MMRAPSETAARSERANASFPAFRMACVRRSTDTIESTTLPAEAPRPPITNAMSPIAAAAAWVVAVGRRPIRTTPCPGA